MVAIPLTPQRLANYYGGDASSNSANIPTPGHSPEDRGTSVTINPSAPDGVLVHCHNGGDPLAVKDKLREDGFLPRFEPNRVSKAPQPSSRPQARAANDIPPTLRNSSKVRQTLAPSDFDIDNLTYEYVNLDGEVVYKVERVNKSDGRKDFYFKSPDDKGGWKTGRDVDPVFYRWLDIVGAPMEAIIFMVEGQHKADKIAAWGFPATSLKGLPEDMRSTVEGRTFAILPDNDKTGTREAKKAAEKLKAAGAYSFEVTLTNLPEKGDVIDWLGNADELEALTIKAQREAAHADDPEIDSYTEPMDLWEKLKHPSLPSGLLPSVLEDYARAQSEGMGTDKGANALVALAVCSGAISDRISLQVKQHDTGWKEQARIWVMLVGDPSAKKSPLINAAKNPLEDINTLQMQEYDRKLTERNQLANQERALSEMPKNKRAVISNTTIEAAQNILKDSPDGLLSVNDELIGWIGSMDKYNGGRGGDADRAFWLQSYNGGNYIVDRVSRGSTLIENCSVSLIGGIQPDPLRNIVSGLKDDGLLQRFIPVVISKAKRGVDKPMSGEVERYNELIGQLHRLRPPARMALSPPVLRFSEGAQDVFREVEDRNFELLDIEKVSPKLASHFGKYDGMYARLCIVWHCVENACSAELPKEITKGTALKVARFLRDFIQLSAMAFYNNVLGVSDDHEHIIDFAGHLLANPEKDKANVREVSRGPRQLRNLEKREKIRLLEKLDAFGWLEPMETPTNSNEPRWSVNPKIHKVFAERAEVEKRQRLKTREVMASLRAA